MGAAGHTPTSISHLLKTQQLFLKTLVYLWINEFDCLLVSPARRMMEQSLRGEVMKLQDLPDVVVSVSRNPHGYKLAWDFLRANWQTLIKKSV